MNGHPVALRTPWYVGARAHPPFDRFDERAEAPAIQKYDREDFVAALVKDPRASLCFDRTDRWSFAVPWVPGTGTTLRQRLRTSRLVTTPMRKLYQPSHQRFYAVTIELYCDAPGLPRPSPEHDPKVRFAVRRLVPTVQGEAADVRALVRAATKDFLRTRDEPSDQLEADFVDDVATMLRLDHDDQAWRAAFEGANRALLDAVSVTQQLQGWYVDEATGRGRWAPVPEADRGGPDPARRSPLPPNVVEGSPGSPRDGEVELELPMSRIPPHAAQCDKARTRSIWFGVVPTFSGDLDVGGNPRFDDRATYVLQCVARRPRPGLPPCCPPDTVRSAPSRSYRLAAFFDPAGNAKRPTHVKLPDFRALAAHAGSTTPPGGVTFERPPGSQLPAPKFGTIPTAPLGKPGGDAPEFCTFSIELITIVASFVLGLFLPVVVFVFGLWWMLLLKFCWPRTGDFATLLAALDTTALGDLTPEKGSATLVEMLGVDKDDATTVLDQLKNAEGIKDLDGPMRRKLVEGLSRTKTPREQHIRPAALPPDPLC